MAAEPCSAHDAELWDGTAPPTEQPNTTHWPPDCDYGGYDVEGVENGGQSPVDPTLPAARLLIGVALCATMLVCGVGNVLYCVALLRCRRLRNTTNLLIANLAVSDLVVAAVCCPFELEYYVVRRLAWSHGPWLCAFVNYVRAASLYVSTNALLAIAVDRYLVILRPLQPRMTRRTAAALLGAAWALSALLAVPAACFSTETPLAAAAPRGAPMQRRFCGQIWPARSALLYKSYFVAVLGAQFVAPVLAMSFCYACIAKELWFKRLPGHQTEQARRRLRSRRRGVVALVGLLTAFVLCWAPFYGFALVRDFFPVVLLRQRHYITVFYVVQCVAVSNSAVSTVLVVTLKPDALLAHALRPCLGRPGGRGELAVAALPATTSATAPSSQAGVELKCTAVSDA